MNKPPLTTIDWNKKFNKEKIKYLLIALLLSFFVSLNAYKLLHRAQSNSELVTVVVASQNIPKNSQLKLENIEFRKIRRDQVPENVIISPQDIIGLTSLINISKEQIIVSQFFKKIKNPNSIGAKISKNMIAIPIGFDWLSAPVPDMKVGDIIDIIASESHQTKIDGQSIITSETNFPIRNAKVIKIVQEGDYEQGGHLIIEVTEDQAKNLMSAKALKVLLNIIIK